MYKTFEEHEVLWYLLYGGHKMEVHQRLSAV